MVPLLVAANLSGETSRVSPELLNFHLKLRAGGSVSTSQAISRLSAREAPTTRIRSWRHVGASGTQEVGHCCNSLYWLNNYWQGSGKWYSRNGNMRRLYLRIPVLPSVFSCTTTRSSVPITIHVSYSYLSEPIAEHLTDQFGFMLRWRINCAQLSAVTVVYYTEIGK
jgi:hypothetical protein